MSDDRALRAGLERNVEQVMQGRPHAFEKAEVIGQLLSTSLGSVPGTAPADRVREALGRAADTLVPDYRRRAARALLGLDVGERTFTKRVDEIVRTYEHAATNGPVVPPRRHRQVLLRAEVPDLRRDLVRALLDIERDFTKVRLSEGRRHTRRRAVQAMSWEQYDAQVRLLANKLRPLRPTVDANDPSSDDWAVIGISRGGLPLAVHLSHLLDCRVFGVVGLWKYRSEHEEEHVTIIDGLYTPPRDASNNPRTLLVVDDVVASGDGLELVTGLLASRYGAPPVRIIEASLLRDVNRAPLGPDSVAAQVYDSSQTWWWLPWEGPAPSEVGPTTTT